MPKGTQFPRQIRQRIIDMRLKESMTLAAIGKVFNCDKSVVSKIIKRFTMRGTVSPAKKKGRPRATSCQLDRNIKRKSVSNPRLSAVQIKVEIGNPKISVSTI